MPHVWVHVLSANWLMHFITRTCIALSNEQNFWFKIENHKDQEQASTCTVSHMQTIYSLTDQKLKVIHASSNNQNNIV